MSINNKIFPSLLSTIEALPVTKVPADRKEVLQELIDYVQAKVNVSKEVMLNFVCTHNSRRSQFSQIWGQTAANYYGVKMSSYSGGVEVTAFNERAVASIKRVGFKVEQEGQENPIYSIFTSDSETPILKTFSKIVEDKANASNEFAAVMTCSHADENCPFIVGAEARIPVRYVDPKAFDDTDQEAEKYDERSLQIATELFYVFSKIN